MSARLVAIRGRSTDTTWGDEAVAHACVSGDPAALAELFDRFQTRVTRYLSRAIGDSGDVEDLLQATFLEIARGQATFDGRSAVATWLLGIATNVLRHHLRSQTRRRHLLVAVATSQPAAGPGSTGDQVVARSALRRVQSILQDLPVEQRLAFVLCEIEGLKAADAAALLEVSEAAVWKRVSEVRKVVRAAFAGEVSG